MEPPVCLARSARVPRLSDAPQEPPEEMEETEEEYESGPDSPLFQAIPFATYILLGLLVLIFLAMDKLGAGNIQAVAMAFGDKENRLIEQGQYWRLVTPIFLHGSWPHLLTNSFSLWLLGSQMERLYGWRKYLIIFLLAGICGNLVSFLHSPDNSLGASGAVFGLVGAGLIFPVRFRSLVPERARTEILRQLLLVAGINLLIGFGWKEAHVDNWAHLGGLAGGSLVALFLIPDALAPTAPRFLNQAVVSFVLTAVLGVVGWAGYSQWRWVQLHTSPPPSPMIWLAPLGDDPWWGVGIPNVWRKNPADPTEWRGPHGAMLHVVDTPATSPLAQKMITLLNSSPVKPERSTVDGKPALLLILQQPDGRHILNLCVIPVYRHLLVLTLDRPVASPQQDQAAFNDFIRILASLRIVHPPADNAAGDNVQPNPSPGATPAPSSRATPLVPKPR